MVLEKLLQTLQSNTDLFRDVEFVRGARVPIIRSIHSLFNIEVDISLNNTLVCILHFYLIKLFHILI